ISFWRPVAAMALATRASSKALTDERSRISTPGSASTSSGNDGPHTLSRAVVVTMISSCSALAAVARATTLSFSSSGESSRPPSDRAASHAAIMDTVYALLQEKSVRDLTMEEVAKRAKVGKPPLYKWWPTKATLVLAMLCERMAPNLEQPSDLTAEASLRFRVRSLIDAFNGPFGTIVAGLIAEGQSEPGMLQQFFDRWVSPRRTATIADL